MKKTNNRKWMNRLVIGAMACLMVFSAAGCGQKEAEEDKSLGERIEDEVLPDHEEAQKEVEDQIVNGLKDAMEEGL